MYFFLGEKSVHVRHGNVYQMEEKYRKVPTLRFFFCYSKSICFRSRPHCSKSSFFVQKFNFDFPRKLSIFLGENSWKCCGFGLFICWQLWFHEKNCEKNFGWKTRENVGGLSKLNFWIKIWLFEQCAFEIFVRFLSWHMPKLFWTPCRCSSKKLRLKNLKLVKKC